MTSQRVMDGIVPDRIERPDSVDAIAELVRSEAARDGWVLPFGGATAMFGQNPVESIPVALDLAGMTGVTDYVPADLTVSVGAGTTWRDLQAALGAEGQTIPIDVPFPEQATVGGVVATGYAGPRRLRDGSLKDLLLGASYVRGDGLVARAGGMVVKNVSGFEIPRLLHGSWGSLAVITSVNLKVIPGHEFETTLQGEALDTVDAAERLLGLTRARTAIAAATVDGTLESASPSVRLTGREAPVRALARDIRDDGSVGWAHEIEVPERSGHWWQDRENRLATDTPGYVWIEIGCQPADVVQTLRALRVALSDPASLAVHASPGTGALQVGFDAGTMSLDTWARVWLEHGLGAKARFVVVSAPREWRSARDVWFIPPGPRKLMQSLKATFDPNDTINRGRLWTSPAEART